MDAVHGRGRTIPKVNWACENERFMYIKTSNFGDFTSLLCRVQCTAKKCAKTRAARTVVVASETPLWRRDNTEA